jgi:Fic family protein
MVRAALARYDGLLQGIINPEILFSPLTICEAVLSSRIEGTQASLEEVLQFEADQAQKIAPEKQLDIQEIINYRTAMQAAVEDLGRRPICTNMIRDLHRIFLTSVRGGSGNPGRSAASRIISLPTVRPYNGPRSSLPRQTSYRMPSRTGKITCIAKSGIHSSSLQY